MQIFKNQITWALFLLLLMNTNSETLTEKMEKYCDGSSMKEIELTQKDFEHIRKKRKNEFYDNYEDIIQWGRDFTNSNKLVSSFTAATVLMCFFLVAIIASIVIYILLLCGFFQKDVTKKIYCQASAVLWVIFAVLFIAYLVFLGLT